MPRVYPPLEGKQPSVSISPSLVESCAGFSAGVVSTLAVHPFDVVKTRLQIEQSTRTRPGNSWRIVKTIAQEALHSGASNANAVGSSRAMHEVGATFTAFYRGLMPNMIGNSVSWALYFMWYGNIKDLVRSTRVHRDPSSDGKLHSSDYFIASGVSGILTAVFTNPIWVIKTRMLSTARHKPGAYKSISHGAAELYKAEGIKGFYRGLLPSLFGVSHGAIQFMAYEQLKNHWALSRPGGLDGLTNWDYLYLSAGAKMVAGSITYPYQVVRARLQIYDAAIRYKGAWDVVKQVFKHEGISGFYRGLGPNLVRVLPSTCVTFLVYENTKFYLPRFWHHYEDDDMMELEAKQDG
ncbi:mitochondrial carrier [Polychaeton citri CBS 116435]|uniref:Mitochondrial carrier n=1 Tax=Polychaeton citri CBS 116435 TaxID=1314669 RepID=A0A9P4Q8U7_9PEZI|nr:mitochondrial carrier [Polychaeton citri CBS 116435]